MTSSLETQRSQALEVLQGAGTIIAATNHGHTDEEIRNSARAVYKLVRTGQVQMNAEDFAALTLAIADSDFKVPGQALVLLKPKDNVPVSVTPRELANAIILRTLINENLRTGDAVGLGEVRKYGDYSLPRIIKSARRAGVELDRPELSDDDYELTVAQLQTFEFRRRITDVDGRGEISHHVAHITDATSVEEDGGIVNASSTDDEVLGVSYAGSRPVGSILEGLPDSERDVILADSAETQGFYRPGDR